MKTIASRKAVPSWVNQREIDCFYKNRPEGFEIDHIIPINNPNICGLHVPWNLQYLTPEQNRLKGNRFDWTLENGSWKKLSP